MSEGMSAEKEIMECLAGSAAYMQPVNDADIANSALQDCSVDPANQAQMDIALKMNATFHEAQAESPELDSPALTQNATPGFDL